MRAEHGYDFGSLAMNSDLFVQVVAHMAAAAVPNSVLQYLKAGQITPLAKPSGGHRPLLMMSFLRRHALKSVMAAKKESVAKCAGLLQYGVVGRPDGANTMIKTIQYFAEADNSRVLVALDLKAAFQNVSRRAMLYSIAQTDADLAAVFSKWYTGTTEHRMHYDSAYTKISANSGVDQGCPLSACGFSAVVDPVLRSVMADICRLHDPGAKLFAYLDDWYLWIKPQYLLQTVAIITVATRSVNLDLQSTKTQVWKGSCQDPSPPEFQDKVTLTLSCLGGHLQSHGDIEPSPVVLGEQTSMEKTTQRFQRIATTLADVNAEGLNAQAVNDLLTMYVGAASQHVLRMSFVPEREAHNCDRQVTTFWSHRRCHLSDVLCGSHSFFSRQVVCPGARGDAWLQRLTLMFPRRGLECAVVGVASMGHRPAACHATNPWFGSAWVTFSVVDLAAPSVALASATVNP